MQITFLSCTVEPVKTSKGSYEKAAIAYKDKDGKIQGKNLVSFNAQTVIDTLKVASPNVQFEVETEKDDNGYWQWKSISEVKGDVPTKVTPKSTYETPEERAKKQCYIIRQSSISSAVEFSGNTKNLKTPEEVIEVAKKFEAYVFGDNDIPLEVN